MIDDYITENENWFWMKTIHGQCPHHDSW